ncbi:hypothetical protein F3Y22_tig00002237pilonHSYRG00016 [Hibiscus syriacus]|uniref:Retrotransposon Copia-like N-terminal domain-containing protein n=1 Tax=Hibiscus syriacus TaxID=106335 RepID=A0A6A3CRK6_HIBSY|nr:hypothetical protein F3Y22_tig00002237pilonHSYRG00016 [Hibiscus syriacus]
MMNALNDNFDNGGNPYYLHQSDNPGMILVTQPLTSDNFHSWKWSMMLALSAKNKLGFMDGSIPAPDTSSPELLNAWTRANNLVNSWILNSVSKDIAASLLYHTTAAEIWRDLVESFQQSNSPHLFQLKKKLTDLVQGQMTVSTYYTQLKIIWDELFSIKQLCSCLSCTCGGVRRMIVDHQQKQVIQYLMGLNESFAHVRGQILLLDPLPSVVIGAIDGFIAITGACFGPDNKAKFGYHISAGTIWTVGSKLDPTADKERRLEKKSNPKWVLGFLFG